ADGADALGERLRLRLCLGPAVGAGESGRWADTDARRPLSNDPGPALPLYAAGHPSPAPYPGWKWGEDSFSRWSSGGCTRTRKSGEATRDTEDDARRIPMERCRPPGCAARFLR